MAKTLFLSFWTITGNIFGFFFNIKFCDRYISRNRLVSFCNKSLQEYNNKSNVKIISLRFSIFYFWFYLTICRLYLLCTKIYIFYNVKQNPNSSLKLKLEINALQLRNFRIQGYNKKVYSVLKNTSGSTRFQ